LQRFAQGVTVHTQVCPGLVDRVEAGRLDDEETLALLQRYLDPLLDAGIDTLVLGCTHYPFLLPAISRIVGSSVEIVDPAPAVARQAGRVLDQARPGTPRNRQGRRTLYTSGDVVPFEQAVAQLLDDEDDIRAARWDQTEGSLVC
jgi:glutamate racemase